MFILFAEFFSYITKALYTAIKKSNKNKVTLKCRYIFIIEDLSLFTNIYRQITTRIPPNKRDLAWNQTNFF